MKQSRLSLLVFLLISMLACVIPGLEAPAPALVDPNVLSTIVVSTANAAASQTAVAQPSATGIPADATVPRMTGISLEQLQDGTTKYIDHDGGFELIFPAGWLELRPNSDEFNDSLADAGARNSSLRTQMTADQAAYDAKLDRLYSYILRPDIGKNALYGFSKVAWDSEDATLLDNDTMGELTRVLESSKDLRGFRSDTAQLRENDNAVMTIEIGGRFPLSDGQGGTIPVYATILIFKPTSHSVTRIAFAFLEAYNAQISTDVKSVIQSIKLVGQ